MDVPSTSLYGYRVLDLEPWHIPYPIVPLLNMKLILNSRSSCECMSYNHTLCIIFRYCLSTCVQSHPQTKGPVAACRPSGPAAPGSRPPEVTTHRAMCAKRRRLAAPPSWRKPSAVGDNEALGDCAVRMHENGRIQKPQHDRPGKSTDQSRPHLMAGLKENSGSPPYLGFGGAGDTKQELGLHPTRDGLQQLDCQHGAF